MADLLSLFHPAYFSPLLISNRITIIIHPLPFFSLLAKEANVDISIHALMCSEQPPSYSPDHSPEESPPPSSSANSSVECGIH